MSALAHDNRLFAHTWDRSTSAATLGARIVGNAGSLSAWFAARTGRAAVNALNSRLRRDAFGADAPMPLESHLRDTFGRPVH